MITLEGTATAGLFLLFCAGIVVCTAILAWLYLFASELWHNLFGSKTDAWKH